jgi:ABC-2 type transport system ATP-binding protein
MEEAERLCGRVVLLDAGRVVAAGTPDELVARTGIPPRVLLRTSRALPPDWLGALGTAAVVDGRGTSVTVALPDNAAVPAVLAAATRAGAEILELTLHRPNLADAFFALTGRALRDEEPEPSA